MRYSEEYKKKAIDKYKGKEWDWYGVACDLARKNLVEAKESHQEFPSKDTYKKILFIEQHGTEIQKKWARFGYKSPHFLYQAIKNPKYKLPDDKLAVTLTVDQKEVNKIITIPEGEEIPEFAETLEGAELYHKDGYLIEDKQVLLFPKSEKMPENVSKLSHDNVLAMSRENFEETDKFDLKNVSWIKKTSVWNFPQFDNRFGGDEKSMAYPSRIPGQILMNLMHGFTEPGDLIVDPFAGSGTNYEVVTQATIHEDMKAIRDRTILCYD